MPHRPCPPRGGRGLTELRPLIPRASLDHVKLVVEREVPGSDLSQYYIREGTGAERGSPAAALAAGLREQAGDPDSYLARSVSGVVLEYDLAGLAPGRSSPPPGVFLTPKGRPPVRGAFSSGTGILRACLRRLPRSSAGTVVVEGGARTVAKAYAGMGPNHEGVAGASWDG